MGSSRHIQADNSSTTRDTTPPIAKESTLSELFGGGTSAIGSGRQGSGYDVEAVQSTESYCYHYDALKVFRAKEPPTEAPVPLIEVGVACWGGGDVCYHCLTAGINVVLSFCLYENNRDLGRLLIVGT